MYKGALADFSFDGDHDGSGLLRASFKHPANGSGAQAAVKHVGEKFAQALARQQLVSLHVEHHGLGALAILHRRIHAFWKGCFHWLGAAVAGAFLGTVLGDFHSDLLGQVEDLSLLVTITFDSVKISVAVCAFSINGMNAHVVRIGYLLECFTLMPFLRSGLAFALS
ncbi:MAG: hypothetical protein R3F19_16825 [Verrucomicrobiales bacterium]